MILSSGWKHSFSKRLVMKRLLLLLMILNWALPVWAQLDTTWMDKHERDWSLRDLRSIEMARQYREDRFNQDLGKRLSYGSNFADSLTYVSSALWSGVEAVKVVNGYAYCCLRNGLVIVDVSDFTKPSFVSKLYLPCGYRSYIDVDPEGNYVYIPGNEDLCIIDVTNKANPRVVSKYVVVTILPDNPQFLFVFRSGPGYQLSVSSRSASFL
jgi:hypothetical protein